MKELKIKIGGIWTIITAVVITAMLCGTAIFISTQYNQTQKSIAETKAQADKESANKLSDGLDGIGQGICQTSTRKFAICN